MIGRALPGARLAIVRCLLDACRDRRGREYVVEAHAVIAFERPGCERKPTVVPGLVALGAETIDKPSLHHEPTERVSVAALEGMLDVVLALLDEAAALP